MKYLNKNFSVPVKMTEEQYNRIFHKVTSPPEADDSTTASRKIAEKEKDA